MNNRFVKFTALFTTLALFLAGCSGSGPAAAVSPFTAENDILSYEPIDTEKRIVTIGKYDSFDEKPMEAVLEARFPEIDVVFVETLAGPDPFVYMALQDQQGELPHIQICKVEAEDYDFLYDLSAESFLSRYNLTSLNGLNIDGKLYQLPTTNSVQGIVYNKTLFETHGWETPETLDEFYDLCEEISAAGIRPFGPCTKYMEQIIWLGLGFSYDEIMSDMEKQLRYNEFIQGNTSCQGLLEPAFEVLRELYKKGLLTEEDFSASITQYGYSLLNGETAMMPRSLNILRLPQEEGANCEFGFMGFPTKEPGQSWMQLILGTKLSVSKTAMEDEQRRKDILAILDYISTNEGQKVLQKMFYGISSLTSYQKESAFEFKEIQDCMERGQILYTNLYGNDEDVDVFRQWIIGELTMEEMIAANDGFESADPMALLNGQPIGRAQEDFTVLETSLYNADVMREKTGADIALLLNRSYFKGNMASIYQGDIVYPERFRLKGVGAKDALTVYEITGANLKKLMEHPLINGGEVNAMYAPSGLKMTYAPWAAMDQNVESLTLSDGTPLDDQKLYTVAAWAGSIDEGYLSGTMRTCEELGSNQELMTFAIQESGEIRPVADGRLVLNWDIVGQ